MKGKTIHARFVGGSLDGHTREVPSMASRFVQRLYRPRGRGYTVPPGEMRCMHTDVWEERYSRVPRSEAVFKFDSECAIPFISIGTSA